MKTIFHGNVDGYQIITGFADATPDPMATMAKIAPMLPGLPEQQAVNEIQAKINARRQEVIDKFTGMFGHEPFELRSPSEADWYSKAKLACENDVQGISSLLVEPVRLRDAAVKKLVEENTVYFQPGELEMLDKENKSAELIPLFLARTDREQLQIDGIIVPDFRGVRVFIPGAWTDRVISKLGDKPDAHEIAEQDLTDENRAEIAAVKEAARLSKLTAEEKAAEVKMILDGLASQAAARKDEEIIKGESTDHALRNAQSWYREQEQKVKSKYGLS
ncbi:MAG TPA: hypothetical protein VJ248_07235 [Candidatus Udaeobacter sp.]|nr:hypothetical protein [Candidatus Udaeobacter sp.]